MPTSAPCHGWGRRRAAGEFQIFKPKENWREYLPVFTLQLRAGTVLILTQKVFSFMVRRVSGDSQIQKGQGRGSSGEKACHRSLGILAHAHSDGANSLPQAHRAQCV